VTAQIPTIAALDSDEKEDNKPMAAMITCKTLMCLTEDLWNKYKAEQNVKNSI
jgi:hypothetical protein